MRVTSEEELIGLDKVEYNEKVSSMKMMPDVRRQNEFRGKLLSKFEKEDNYNAQQDELAAFHEKDYKLSCF